MKPTITFVTAFIELYEDRSKDKSVEKYITYFKQLAASGIHICLYVSTLYEKHGLALQASFPNVKLMKIINIEETITYNLIQKNNPLLPAHRTDYHDTIPFISLMNAKFEFVYIASLQNPFDTEHFAWIDFGICHMIKNIDYTLSRLYTVSCSQLKTPLLAMPGCWTSDISHNMMPQITSHIHWRFAGSFFLGDKYSIMNMHKKILEAIPVFIKTYSTIVWEVNIWAWIEKYMNVTIDWFSANHDDSIIRIPFDYVKVVASLSAIPSRFNNIKLVIDSLIQQVDHLYLNLCEHYNRFPSYKKDNTLDYLMNEEPYKTKITILYGTDYGPSTKYIGALNHITPEQWIFFCDDDQEYHPELIHNMKKNIQHIGVYQNRYNIVTTNGSGGVIHGYVGNIIHRSCLDHLLNFPLPDSARFVDDQWMSIFFYKNKVNLYPSGIEAYNDIYKTLYNGHEKISVDSLSALNNRDLHINLLEDFFKVKFIEKGFIVEKKDNNKINNNNNNNNNNNSTVFVFVTDMNYYHRCKKTILDLRSCGEWKGEIVCITVGFNMNNNFKQFYNISEVKFPEIDKNEYVRKIGSGFPESDGREITKLTQWEKIHVFDKYFTKWERVIYLDAGLRVLDSVNYLLELDYKGRFLCPGEYYTKEQISSNKFECQLSKKDSSIIMELIAEFGEYILNERYFLNCIWIYDTAILKTIHKDEFIELMNKYPLFRTNEMGVMNLIIAMKYKLWKPFPTVASNGKFLFDWCELNRPGTVWNNYCLIKYPVTISFDDT